MAVYFTKQFRIEIIGCIQMRCNMSSGGSSILIE